MRCPFFNHTLVLLIDHGDEGSFGFVLNRLTDLGMSEGFDVGFEMSGQPSALGDLIDAMHHGGKVALLGLPSSSVKFDWSKIVFKGLTLKGIYGREMFETWYKMASMLQSGLEIAPIISHHLPYTDFADAFEIMHTGQSGKIILDWTS